MSTVAFSPCSLLLILGAIIFIVIGIASLIGGVTRIKMSGPIYRDEQPAEFWAAVCVYFGGAVLMFFMVFGTPTSDPAVSSDTNIKIIFFALGGIGFLYLIWLLGKGEWSYRTRSSGEYVTISREGNPIRYWLTIVVMAGLFGSWIGFSLQ